MEGVEFWGLAVLASLLIGLSKGGLPIVGILSVPVLSLAISPVTAAGLLLPIYVVSDMFGLYAYRRAFDKRVLAILIPATTIGVGLGWATAHLVPEDLVGGIVGLIGACFAANLLLRRTDPAQRPVEAVPGLFWGTLTGFTSFVSHAGGPPYQVYVLPLKLDKMVFAGTSTILFAYVNAIKLVPYFALGQLSLENLEIAAWLSVPSALAVFAGVRLVKIVPTKLFFRIVVWALLVISLRLMWQTAASLTA